MSGGFYLKGRLLFELPIITKVTTEHDIFEDAILN